MTQLRVVSYRVMRKVAVRKGFIWDRCEGSHNIFQNEAGFCITIPNHVPQPIVRPLLRKIIRDLGMTVDEYNQLLDDL